MTAQHAEAERIHIGDLSQVKNLSSRQIPFLDRCEDVLNRQWRQGVIHIAGCEWPGESKDRAIDVRFRRASL